MGVFYRREVFTPRSWTLGHQAPETGLQFLIKSLRLSIRLGMVAGREAGRGPDEAAKLPPETGDKLRAPVRHDVPGKSVETKTWCNKTSAVSLADGGLGKAIKCVILENLSTTVRTVVLPLDSGSPVTKSTEMSDQGRLGVGSGLSRPIWGLEEVLFLAQMVQAATYSLTSLSIDVHQNRCLMKYMVLLTPGWQVSSDV